MQANGGTNIQAGLRKAAGMLTDSSREQFIIVLSDGEPTYSYKGTEATFVEGFFREYNFRITQFDYTKRCGEGSSYGLEDKYNITVTPALGLESPKPP